MTFLRQAQSILDQNTITFSLKDSTYKYLTPSKDYYQHHWLWDGAIHAMALSYLNETAAKQELEMLFLGQWENGHIGHIRFNPEVKGYFPGAHIWKTEPFITDNIISSGIIQPPLIATALKHLYSVTKDKSSTAIFIRNILPKLKKFHNYLQSTRDPQNTGLIPIIHPWESGMDNSPRFDTTLSKIRMSDIPQEVVALVHKKRSDDVKQDSEERPVEEDYYKYIYLVHLYAGWNWDAETILKETPFKVIDIVVNSIWCRANADLAWLCKEVNDNDSEIYNQRSTTTLHALEPLFDPAANTIADLIVPFSGSTNTNILNSVIQKLTNPKEFATPYPVPSVSVSDPLFEPERYWRGPSWPITNLLLIEGLNFQNTSESEVQKQTLIDKTISMIEKFGFWEYFHPISGKDKDSALGFNNFSWTAAIYIYLINKYRS